MSDSARVPLEGETPVNPYSLLEAVNRSSDTAHMAWLVFLGILTYLMIAVAGVTHRDLLLETPVSLPIVDVNIQLTQFFQFAPIVLVLFHLGLISQLALLARKTLEFDNAIKLLETTERRTHPLRLELHNFFFVQAMGGPHRSLVMGTILHAMSWLTLVVLPVVLILYIQVVFLPYHNVWITWTHRIALLFDIAVLVLIGVFLMRAETSFFQAFWRHSKANPVSFMVTTILLMLVTFFSFFIATVPGERLDRIARAAIGKSLPDGAGPERTYQSGFVLPYLTAGSDGSLFGIFRRNLVVTDTDLVLDAEVSVGEPTLSLRGRDLRFAKLDRSDLHQADFTGANLNWASLKGADLRDAWLQCADVDELLLSEDRVVAQCMSARGADFSRAKLIAVDFTGVDASFAKFEEANLDGAELRHGILVGANFFGASLRYANLPDVEAKGANFLTGLLQGANMTGAKLYATDFTSAGLSGAMLAHAHLEGANFQGATLEGASLAKAVLRGADFSRAKITGADLRGAGVWLTKPPSRDSRGLADFNGLAVSPPTKSDLEALEREVKADGDAGLSEQMADALNPLIEDGGSAWKGSDDGRVWQSMVDNQSVSAPPKPIAPPSPTPVAANNFGDTDSGTGDDAAPGFAGDVDNSRTVARASSSSFSSYGSRLTSYLSKLMCRAQWADGSVARGVVRRAMQRKFRGDLVEIGQQLEAPSCAPSKRIPDDLKMELTIAIDRIEDQ